MRLIRGAEVAEVMNSWMRNELAGLEGESPKLAIVRVGENPDDVSYERGAVKRMEKIGLRCECDTFPGDISDEKFREAFAKINADEEVTGILLLRPLPPQIDENAVIREISPE